MATRNKAEPAWVPQDPNTPLSAFGYSFLPKMGPCSAGEPLGVLVAQPPVAGFVQVLYLIPVRSTVRLRCQKRGEEESP